MASFRKYQTKSGYRWEFLVYITDPSSGRPKRIHKRGFKHKNEAELAVSHLRVDDFNHGYTEDNRTTYGQVYDYFMDSYKNTVEGSTLNRVLGLFKHHVLPALGNYPIKDITVPMCQKIVNKWSQEFTDYKKIKAYSGKVFKTAQSLKIIYDNPMSQVALPKIESKPKKNFYDRQQLIILLNCIEQDYAEKNYKAFALLWLVAFTGMRRQEVLALKWSDINLSQKSLSINKAIKRTVDNKLEIGVPKTKSSYRILGLDDKTIQILNEWKQKQAKELKLFGFDNIDYSDQWIFQNSKNTFISTSEPNKWLANVIKRHNLPHLTLHGLRHTFSTISYESGINPLQLKEQLGHSDISTTLQIYTHLSKEKKNETINKFTDYLEGKNQNSTKN